MWWWRWWVVVVVEVVVFGVWMAVVGAVMVMWCVKREGPSLAARVPTDRRRAKELAGRWGTRRGPRGRAAHRADARDGALLAQVAREAEVGELQGQRGVAGEEHVLGLLKMSLFVVVRGRCLWTLFGGS